MSIILENPLVAETILNQLGPAMATMGENHYMKFEWNMGIKNGLKKLLCNKWLSYVRERLSVYQMYW